MPAPFLHAIAAAAGRPNSEDRAEVFERGDHLVVVVADGAGGIAGGGVAADALIEAACAFVLDETANLGEVGSWVRVFEDVDHALAQKMSGETTGVVIVVSPCGLVGVSAGDSSAWLVLGTGSTTYGATGPRPARGREVSHRRAPTPAGEVRATLHG